MGGWRDGDNCTQVRCRGRPETPSLPELQAKLGSSPDGLGEAEARRRLEQYGYNEITEKKTNPLLTFLSYLWVPSPG
jgi:H+-transporting ATPase